MELAGVDDGVRVRPPFIRSSHSVATRRRVVTDVTSEDLVPPDRSSQIRRSALRWLVHVGLIVTAMISLVLEPELTLHVVFGVLFVLLVMCHLLQRRRVSRRLARRLLLVRKLLLPGSRMALADGFLFIITSAMLFSGFWDLWAPHHTKIRWHAITGVVLTVFLIVHSLRRRKRLRLSTIR